LNDRLDGDPDLEEDDHAGGDVLDEPHDAELDEASLRARRKYYP
jgi:hypothetical protein